MEEAQPRPPSLDNQNSAESEADIKRKLKKMCQKPVRSLV